MSSKRENRMISGEKCTANRHRKEEEKLPMRRPETIVGCNQLHIDCVDIQRIVEFPRPAARGSRTFFIAIRNTSLRGLLHIPYPGLLPRMARIAPLSGREAQEGTKSNGHTNGSSGDTGNVFYCQCRRQEETESNLSTKESAPSDGCSFGNAPRNSSRVSVDRRSPNQRTRIQGSGPLGTKKEKNAEHLLENRDKHLAGKYIESW